MARSARSSSGSNFVLQELVDEQTEINVEKSQTRKRYKIKQQGLARTLLQILTTSTAGGKRIQMVVFLLRQMQALRLNAQYLLLGLQCVLC